MPNEHTSPFRLNQRIRLARPLTFIEGSPIGGIPRTLPTGSPGKITMLCWGDILHIKIEGKARELLVVAADVDAAG